MATKALFITLNDLKRKSIISGNTDDDKLIQFVEVAQDLHIQNYLGGNLYDKLQDLILTDTLDDVANVNYKNLINQYVKPMLIWFSQSSYLPFASYNIGNGGIYKHIGDNKQAIDKDELVHLMGKVNETADFYTRRFLDYMDYNKNLFPEYNTSTNEQMSPDTDSNFSGGIFLG